MAIELIDARNAARKAKNFKEADRIRDELAAMGIELKDRKDGTDLEGEAMMARAQPKARAAAVPAGGRRCWPKSFRASIEELTGDDYSERSRRPGPPRPTTRRRSPRGSPAS